ncbi:PepSY-associated TM helix domain-containing protein [Sphingopyxis granuli]|uniref:PepSY-associated TM helix domain-containing protein n=1 Tax=Sphingopyxis granuli TaxID=267128 RepID=UPI00301CD3B2
MSRSSSRQAGPKRGRKAFWLKQLHTWHWMSSAICLIGLLLFAVTGFTLNHAADIEAAPQVSARTAQLPPALLDQLAGAAPAGEADEKAPLPPSVAAWVEAHFPVKVSADAEWSDGEVYLPAPRPGGDAWVAIDRATGAASAEITDRGWISYLNDLHKGRNSGGAWSLFIDIFAFACLVFAITGLFLLQLHAAKRRSTWPIVAAGLAIPAAIAIVSIH